MVATGGGRNHGINRGMVTDNLGQVHLGLDNVGRIRATGGEQWRHIQGIQLCAVHNCGLMQAHHGHYRHARNQLSLGSIADGYHHTGVSGSPGRNNSG